MADLADLVDLWKAHGDARVEFEKACVSDDMSREDFEAIRERYHATMRAYHNAIGFGDAVGTAQVSEGK